MWNLSEKDVEHLRQTLDWLFEEIDECQECGREIDGEHTTLCNECYEAYGEDNAESKWNNE